MFLRVLAAGVNSGPGARRLRFAEKDAIDLARVFSSDLAHSDTTVNVMLGPEVTVERYAIALAALLASPPEHLILFFSGHGGPDGVLMADGTFPHRELAWFLRRVRSRTVLLVLDVCSAASLAPHVEGGDLGKFGAEARPEWYKLLANAHPGFRIMFSTGAGRTAAEGGAVSNGHFTSALISALESAPGSLCAGRRCWISEGDAFVEAAKRMVHQHGQAQIPQQHGIRGDLPLTVSQHEGAIGVVQVTASRVPRSANIDITVLAFNRKHVPTRIRCLAYDDNGVVFDQRARLVLPSSETDVGTMQYAPPLDRAARTALGQLSLLTGRQMNVGVSIEVLDALGRVLGETEVRFWFVPSLMTTRGYGAY